MCLLIIHTPDVKTNPLCPVEPPVMSSRKHSLERLWWKILWILAGTADLILLKKGQTSGSSPVEIHRILHVEAQEAWPGSGLDVPAQDNSSQQQKNSWQTLLEN